MTQAYDMSKRKFLKPVGVTSQQAEEKPLQSVDSSGKRHAIKTVLTIDEPGMRRAITGEIMGND